MIYWFIENQSEAVVWVIILTVTSAHPANNMGLNPLSGRKSYRKISWSLEAARFRFSLFQSL